MSKRSRPRRYERREVAAARHDGMSIRAIRWAKRALVGAVAAWLVTVAVSGVIVSVADTPMFLWGFLGPSRLSNPPLEFEIGRGDVMLLSMFLMVVPVVLAATGLVQTRQRVSAARPDRPALLSVWSQAGAVTAVALLPNVLGCFWISSTRPYPSDFILLPEAWPYVVVVFVPIIWAARDLSQRRVDQPRP